MYRRTSVGLEQIIPFKVSNRFIALDAYNTQARSFLQTANGVLQNMLASPPAVNGQLTIQVPLYVSTIILPGMAFHNDVVDQGAAQTVTINQGFTIQYGNVWTNYDPNNIP